MTGNPNSSNVWLAPITAARLPVPETWVVPYSHAGCISLFDGAPSAEFDRLVDAVTKAAEMIGYPVFVRTDLASAKHSGTRAFKVESADQVASRLLSTIEDNELKFWTEIGPTAFLVRRYLDLPAPFTAFGGLPISREFRFFADSDRVICRHPYWPADAVERHIDGERPDNWREMMWDLRHKMGEINAIDEMAIAAARACGGGRWSVDFAQDRDGKWWLLDMATMEQSYHWPGCPNGPADDAAFDMLLSEAGV